MKKKTGPIFIQINEEPELRSDFVVDLRRPEKVSLGQLVQQPRLKPVSLKIKSPKIVFSKIKIPKIKVFKIKTPANTESKIKPLKRPVVSFPPKKASPLLQPFNLIRPLAAYAAFDQTLKNSWRQLRREAKKYRHKYSPKAETISQEIFIGAAPTPSRWQSWLIFMAALIILILPLKFLSDLHLFQLSKLAETVMDKSQSALISLMAASTAASHFELPQAQADFTQAGQNFIQANDDMASVNNTLLSLAALSSDHRLKLAAESKKFINAGLLASDLGANLTAALNSVYDNKGSDWINVLDNFSVAARRAATDADNLNQQLLAIDLNNLPVEYQARFSDLRLKMAPLTSVLSQVVDNIDNLKMLLGASQDKRYLLVFQNNAELRASGGFLGSYALVDFSQGKISNIEVPAGGSYDTAGGLTVKVKAPEPLWLVNPQWYFWDANWWPDWPTTAKNLMWFYEKSGGPSVDGVITFTPSVVEQLLNVTGPIDMTKDYGVIITADNFWEEVEKTSERDNLLKINPALVANLPAGEKNKPKKIIGDLMAKIMAVLPQKLTKDGLVKLLAAAQTSIVSKQAMAYFVDPSLETAARRYGFDGALKSSPFDYLDVINSNIAGQKTDRVINESISHEASVAADGSVIDTVTIVRANTAFKNEPLVGVRNVDWMRIYVPLGSTLISATGFTVPEAKFFSAPDPTWQDNSLVAATENQAVIDPLTGTHIYQESGRSVFANWTMVDPGQSVTIKLQYKLPFNLLIAPAGNDFLERLNQWLNPGQTLYPYSLLVQKQPGAENVELSSIVVLPANLDIAWNAANGYNSTGQYGSAPFDSDQYLAVLLKHH